MTTISNPFDDVESSLEDDVEWPSQAEIRKQHLSEVKGIIQRFVGYEELAERRTTEIVNLTRWTERQVCNDCWSLHNENQQPTRLRGSKPEKCIMCDKDTDCGIYVRIQITWPVKH